MKSNLTRPISAPLALPLRRALTDVRGGPLLPGGSLIAYLGDSITANGRSGSSTARTSLPRGFSTWADILSNKRAFFKYESNFGVGGDTTAQAMIRVPNVISSGAKACVILAGTNDISTGVPASTIITNLQSMYDDLNAVGIWTVGIPILPRGSTYALSGAQLAVVAEVNNWIRAQTTRSRFRLCDPVPAFEDTAAGGFVPLSGMTYDGIHPSAKGAYVIGKALAPVIASMFGTDAKLGVVNSYLNNPSLSGTAGTKNTLTGEVATGWVGHSGNTGGATVVASKRVDASGVEWQRFTFSGTYTGTTKAAYFYQDIAATDFLAGESPRGFIRVRVGGGSVGLRLPLLKMVMGSFTATEVNWPVETDEIPTEEWEGTLRTFDFTMPSDSTAPRFFVDIRLANTSTVDPVSGWVEFSRPGIIKD